MTRYLRHHPVDWAHALSWVRPDGTFSVQLAGAYLTAQPCERAVLLGCLPPATADALKAQCDPAIEAQRPPALPPALTEAGAAYGGAALFKPSAAVAQKIADCLTALAAEFAPAVQIEGPKDQDERAALQAVQMRQALLLQSWTNAGIAALSDADTVTVGTLQHLAAGITASWLHHFTPEDRPAAERLYLKGVYTTLATREALK